MPSSTDLSEIELASLLCSRLCHDLLSPVGAMTNGLELLADEQDPQMRARVVELLEQSAKISTDSTIATRQRISSRSRVNESRRRCGTVSRRRASFPPRPRSGAGR